MASEHPASSVRLVNDWFQIVLQLSSQAPCVGCWPVRLHNSSEVHTIEVPSDTGQLGIRPDCCDAEGRQYIVRCRSCAEQVRGVFSSRGLAFRAIPTLNDGRR